MSNSSPGLNVAIVGATGVVGQEAFRVLAQRKFPVAKLKALASERSAGSTVRSNGHSVVVETMDESSFRGVDVAFFAVGADLSLTYAPLAVEAGALVIDKSSAWRMKPDVPLVVPEVNAEDIRSSDGIIATPNCCTIPLTVVLEPLRARAGLERVLVSTYQAASGAGKALVEELEHQTAAVAQGRTPDVKAYPHQLVHNVVPGGWKPEPEGYNDEEVKLVNETRKILHEPDLRLAATCVRVPVPTGHAESVFIETRDGLSADEARALLSGAPGIVVQDDPAAGVYPTPADVAGTDEVYVGRVRKDPSTPRGLALWIVSDNLRKGAALNAVQIAERAIEMGVL